MNSDGLGASGRMVTSSPVRDGMIAATIAALADSIESLTEARRRGAARRRGLSRARSARRGSATRGVSEARSRCATSAMRDSARGYRRPLRDSACRCRSRRPRRG